MQPGTLSRAGLAQLIGSSFKRFVHAPPHDGKLRHLRMTSGTTGGLPMLGVRVMDEYSENQRAWFSGIERPLICFGPLQVRLIYVSYFRHDPEKYGPVLALDPQDMRPSFSALAAEFSSDGVIGWPFMMLRAAAHMTERARQNVRAIRLTGELLRDSIATLLHERFENAEIRSQYVTAELSFISKMSCAYSPPRVYHPTAGVAVEIGEPDEHGIGDVLVSTVINGEIPVTRYKTGDMGRLILTPCACGEQSSFELLGRRGYDYIKVAGHILVREEVERVAGLFRDSVRDYRLEATEVLEGGNVVGALTLRVLPHGSITRDELRALTRRFQESLYLSTTNTLDALVERGIFRPLEIACVDSPFPEKHKDVRLEYRERV